MTEPTTATVTTLENGWSMCTFGAYSVSVAPDGSIHLPRHITAEEVGSGDFVGAMLAAATLGPHTPADTATAAGDSPMSRRAVVREGREGPTPPGAPSGARPLTGSIGRRSGHKGTAPQGIPPPARPERQPRRGTTP
jgi:hypothetical protein